MSEYRVIPLPGGWTAAAARDIVSVFPPGVEADDANFCKATLYVGTVRGSYPTVRAALEAACRFALAEMAVEACCEGSLVHSSVADGLDCIHKVWTVAEDWAEFQKRLDAEFPAAPEPSTAPSVEERLDRLERRVASLAAAKAEEAAMLALSAEKYTAEVRCPCCGKTVDVLACTTDFIRCPACLQLFNITYFTKKA